jgi:Acetyltransferase (GNAT) family
MTDVRIATKADAKLLSAVLAGAFRTDPLQAWLYPNPNTRPQKMRVTFQAALEGAIRRRTAWTNESRTSVAIFTPPPRQEPIPKRVLLRHGPALMLASGTDALTNIARLNHIQSFRPRSPHWYLFVVGTDPTSQGQGLARAVLECGLARSDADHLPAYLESSHPDNVPYYEKFGFEVIRELRPPGGPSLWLMLRPPQGTK